MSERPFRLVVRHGDAGYAEAEEVFLFVFEEGAFEFGQGGNIPFVRRHEGVDVLVGTRNRSDSFFRSKRSGTGHGHRTFENAKPFIKVTALFMMFRRESA